jgi:hypothetical protein
MTTVDIFEANRAQLIEALTNTELCGSEWRPILADLSNVFSQHYEHQLLVSSEPTIEYIHSKAYDFYSGISGFNVERLNYFTNELEINAYHIRAFAESNEDSNDVTNFDDETDNVADMFDMGRT